MERLIPLCKLSSVFKADFAGVATTMMTTATVPGGKNRRQKIPMCTLLCDAAASVKILRPLVIRLVLHVTRPRSGPLAVKTAVKDNRSVRMYIRVENVLRS